MWLALLAGAAVLVGCGVFFALQNLGHADQYASVASFFLALLTAIGSAVALARSKPPEQSTEGSQQSRPRRGWVLNFFGWNRVVIHGNRSVVNINDGTAEMPTQKESGPPS